MVNPGAFQGPRKEFLLGKKPGYAAAVAGGYTRDCIAIIQRCYLKRFPIDLLHDEDPTPEHLASVDDDGPDVEPEEPDEANSSPEEYRAAKEKLEERRDLLQFRKGVSYIILSSLSVFGY